MNVKNNRRKRESVEKIKKVFVDLLEQKEIKDITVTDICKITELNRSTFYANFIDIYDLADKLKEDLENDFNKMFLEEKNKNMKEFFKHIYENQLLYKTYFKLGYDEKYQINISDITSEDKEFDNKYMEYHIAFFKNGLNAIIRKWLDNGCKETPEEMVKILKMEYKVRQYLLYK